MSRYRGEHVAHWVYIEPPTDFEAVNLRGAMYFDSYDLLHPGRVTRVPAGAMAEFPIRRPWTYVYMPVPWVDVSDYLDELGAEPCSVIMDVHFPLMDLEQAIANDDTLMHIIDQKAIMLANLARADAITCPRGEWAADLAEINADTFVLPDLVLPTAAYEEIPITDDWVDVARANAADHLGPVNVELCRLALADFTEAIIAAAEASGRAKMKRMANA